MLALLNEVRGLKSIAFATLGTGKLKYPPNLVADAMFSAFEQFDAASGSGASLKDVSVVVYYKVDHVFKVNTELCYCELDLFHQLMRPNFCTIYSLLLERCMYSTNTERVVGFLCAFKTKHQEQCNSFF